MKVNKEWFIEVPWGKIALISWGNPDGEPVLLVHGRQDSVATFLPLLELLPDVYHYVGFDLPGHGKSDAFPVGVALTRFLFVVPLDFVMRHLKWSNFTYIAHSFGNELGFFYNALYPGRIKKIISLDPAPAFERLMVKDNIEFCSYYMDYYDNYGKNNTNDRLYTKADAIKAVMEARGMNQTQAEVVLSRNLIRVGDDQYRLSWDKRTKLLIPSNYTLEYYYRLFSKNSPPTLCINASQSGHFYIEGREDVDKLLSDLEGNLRNFVVLRVDGNHNVHFVQPETVGGHVRSFLEHNFDNTNSKL